MDEEIRVLHIDDDPDFADVTTVYLEREDDQLTVETATTASEGLERLTTDEFDCVVSDYHLPDMGGLDLLEAVRTERPGLPFILFTGRGSEEVASDAIAAGVSDYLQKEGTRSQYTMLANRIKNAVEKYRAQQQLTVERDQYRFLFERAPVMYAVTRRRDGEPIVENCNQKFLDRLGYTRDAVLGEPLSKFYTDESAESLLDHGGYDRALSGEFVTEERAFVTADGDTVETILRAVPRVDELGDVIGTLTLYIDITERKERERRLEHQNERLDEFARVVSHDLRNPLNVANLRLDLAREECESAHLDDVALALDRMGALIESLLTLTHERERGTEIEPVALAELAQLCWQNVDTTGATLTIETDRTIRASKSSLKRVFENLYRNSVEHGSAHSDPQTNGERGEGGSPDSQTESGGTVAGTSSELSVVDASDDTTGHERGTVSVTVGALDDGFYVEDDGPGIPPDEREQVFETGYSTSHEGTGFGLSIVNEVVETHEWTVHVTDGTAGGARFEFTDVEFAE